MFQDLVPNYFGDKTKAFLSHSDINQLHVGTARKLGAIPLAGHVGGVEHTGEVVENPSWLCATGESRGGTNGYGQLGA